MSACIRLMGHAVGITLLAQACASGNFRAGPDTETRNCDILGTRSDDVGPYFLTGDSAIAAHSVALPGNSPPAHTGEGKGEVFVRFIVSAQGQAEPSSFRVLKATTGAMQQAALAALATYRFRPARTHAGCNVRQEAHIPFVFH